MVKGRSFRALVSFLALLVMQIVAGATPALSAKRAFVVGIDRYDNLDQFRQLRRAVNDAQAIAEALSALGFLVTLKHNTSQSDFFLAFDTFNQAIEEGDTVAFYFSGHGIQISGLNYLLPADAPAPERTVEELLRGRSIQLNALLEQMGRKAPSVRLLIIDACRDNPYRTPGRSIGAAQGLAGLGRVKGTFIMFSADAGQTALDLLPPPIVDSHKNSPYTRTLLPLLREPGHTLPDIARRVRREVEDLVGKVPHDQSPAYYDGISGDFCLTGECKSLEELKREAEQRRRDEMQRLEELERLRATAQAAIKGIEAAERAAQEARKSADLAQSAAREAEAKAGKVAALPEAAAPQEPPSTALLDRAVLTKQIQQQLQRLGCLTGTPDGVWGVKVKMALKSFADITKFSLAQDEPTQTALTSLRAAMTRFAWRALSRFSLQVRQKKPDLAPWPMRGVFGVQERFRRAVRSPPPLPMDD